MLLLLQLLLLLLQLLWQKSDSNQVTCRLRLLECFKWEILLESVNSNWAIFNCVLCNKGSCIAPLYNKSQCAQACSVLNGITLLYQRLARFIWHRKDVEHYILNYL